MPIRTELYLTVFPPFYIYILGEKVKIEVVLRLSGYIICP